MVSYSKGFSRISEDDVLVVKVESFIDRHAGGERGVLVNVDFFPADNQDALPEFIELVSAAGVDNLALVTAKRHAAVPKYFVGTGKADEIKRTVQAHQADVVLFNHELTAAQGRNLEKLCGCRVIDRTELILDIFAQRARSFEGKLQVELAQLEHLRTRLIRGWTHLERQKGGIGLRGPGETQLETDRRLLDVRIRNIKKRLEKVFLQRKLSRRARSRNAVPTVALVGYTNAGKSTLFNMLTSADIFTADQLFATLDPTLRQHSLADIGTVIFADTVGFIRQLPHSLVAAFRATLEEVRQANLLLHVVDCSRQNRRDLIDNVQEVIADVGASEVPQLFVYNKIDLCDEQPRSELDVEGKLYRVWLSAQTGEGMQLLSQALVDCLGYNIVHETVTLQPTEGKLRAKLYSLQAVKAEHVDESGCWVMDVSLDQDNFRRFFAKKTDSQ